MGRSQLRLVLTVFHALPCNYARGWLIIFWGGGTVKNLRDFFGRMAIHDVAYRPLGRDPAAEFRPEVELPLGVLRGDDPHARQSTPRHLRIKGRQLRPKLRLPKPRKIWKFSNNPQTNLWNVLFPLSDYLFGERMRWGLRAQMVTIPKRKNEQNIFARGNTKKSGQINI